MTESATFKLYAYISSVWNDDLTDYLIAQSDIDYLRGMGSDADDDRVARTGTCSFKLNNATGKFDPNSVSAWSGWSLGTKVKITSTYDGVERVKFRGIVNTITLTDDAKYMTRIATVELLDFMQYTEKYALRELSIITHRRGDEAVQYVLDELPEQPEVTQLAMGEYDYEALFDTITPDTVASAELVKIALSEGGYVYCRCDPTYGETFVFETQSTRNGLRTPVKLPVAASLTGDLLKAGSATDRILKAGSAADGILLNEAQDFVVDGTNAGSIERTVGSLLLNDVQITAHPKTIDSSAVVLYSLGSPIKVGPGKTIVVEGEYTHPTKGIRGNAITSTMIQPVATTDYLGNALEDGTGTDLTSSLTITAEYTSAIPRFTIYNGATTKVWVTKLECRGCGVYQLSTLTARISDAALQVTHGVKSLAIDQQYQRDTQMGEAWIKQILDDKSAIRTRLHQITLSANISAENMFAFQILDIGDLVEIDITEFEASGFFYIQGVKANINIARNTITFTWLLKEAMPSETLGTLTPITIQFDRYVDVGTQQVLDFDVIPQIVTAPYLSVLMSVMFDDLTDFSLEEMVRIGVSGAASSEPRIAFRYDHTSQKLNVLTYGFTDTAGYFWSADPSFVSSTWYRIAFVYAHRSAIAVPAFYKNGSQVTNSTTTMPTGSPVSWESSPLCIGGYRDDTVSGYSNALEARIKNLCIYNTLLTAAEVSADNAGTLITRGLIFRGPYCKTSQTAQYYNQNLTESQLVRDTMFGALGIPKGAPKALQV